MKTCLDSLALLAVFTAAACGGDPLDPGAGDDTGSGTNTLFVEGRVTAEPTTPNARAATDFSTEFSIRIGLNSVAVTTGTVTVESRFATTTLTYQDDGNNLGHWVGTAADYDEVYQLDIVSGSDEVRGVVVDGPDIHTFVLPTAGASLDATIANVIEWDSEETADLATFKAEEIDRLTIPDTGTYSMAPGSMKTDQDTARENVLELRRQNRVVPAGAVAGSELAVSVEQVLQVLALPVP
jgi:hypothetical protein